MKKNGPDFRTAGKMFFTVFVACLSIFVVFSGRSSAKSDADKSFEKKDYAAATTLYEQVREKDREKKDREGWKRTTNQLIRCASALGETDRAVQEFFLLCRVDPLAQLDCIPLPWFVPPDTSLAPKGIEKTAEDWLDPVQNKISSPGGTLLAAGILSVSPNASSRSRGLSLLREIAAWGETEPAKPKEPTVETAVRRQASLLAMCFLWKQRIPTLRKAAESEPLRRLTDQLPEPFRAGPYYLLGNAAKHTDDLETAVLYWMRVPILFPEQKILAKESLREAAQALESLGRHDQADRLKKEGEESR